MVDIALDIGKLEWLGMHGAGDYLPSEQFLDVVIVEALELRCVSN